MSVNDTFTKVDAAECADALLEAVAALRHELVTYEREVRQARTRVLRAKPDPLAPRVPDLIAVRQRVNECLDEFERCRRLWRVAFFRLQAQDGKSLGAIAREWGFSRQLVSRLMNGDDDETG